MTETMVLVPRLLSKRVVAEHLGVSVRTVERMLLDGELQGVKVRDGTRVLAESLKEYLERG